MTDKLERFAARNTTGSGFSWMWLGQGGFAYRFGGTTVVIDPYLSDAVTSLPRAYPREAEPSDVAGDLLLTTHGHDDHFDPETVEVAVRQKRMHIGGPPSCHILYNEMKLPEDRFIELRCGSGIEFRGVGIKAVKAAHGSCRGLADAVGYLLSGAGVTVYHVGDSELTDEIIGQTRAQHPDLLVVPINGKWGNMNIREAAALAESTKAKVAIPVHYDMFIGNQEDPQAFQWEVEDRNLNCIVVVAQRFNDSDPLKEAGR